MNYLTPILLFTYTVVPIHVLLMLVFNSIGGILMFGAVVMFDDEFIHIVSISFTALILTELIMVALTVRTWHWAMIAAEVLSLAIYLISVIIFPQSFGKFKHISLKYGFLGMNLYNLYELLLSSWLISLLQICHLC